MQRILFLFFIAAAGVGLVWGCSDDDPDDEGPGDNQVGDPNAPGLDELDTDNVCYEVDQDLNKTTSKVMLLQDISSSMTDNIGGQTKWQIDQAALTNMVTTYDDTIQFGLDFFPNDRDCGVSLPVAEDTAPNNGDNLAALIAATDTLQTTPLLLAMNNFLDASYAPNFMSEGADPYLVVVSDGADSCSDVSAADMTNVTSDLLANGVRTFAIGFGDGVNAEGAAQLTAIAEAGGTPFDTYFNAQDENELNQALESIGEAVIVSCRYALGEVSAEANREWTNIYFDGEPLRRGESCDGDADWTWGNADMTIIEFCQDACTLLEDGKVDNLNVVIMCSQDEVVVV